MPATKDDTRRTLWLVVPVLFALSCGLDLAAIDDDELVDAEDTLSSVTTGIPSSADTLVRLDQPTTNFGSLTSVRVGGTGIEALLRFQVPDGPAITRATLRLYVTGPSVNAADVLRSSSATWSESTVTWNTRPSAGALVGSIVAAPSGQWVQVDVTSAVSRNATIAFVLRGRSSDAASFASRESTARPTLVLETSEVVTGSCQNVACSGRGLCVPVGGVATCACNRGYYPVGLACLADPCEKGGTCFYVDSATGSDGNPGTRAAPWKTLKKVVQSRSLFKPGAYVLLRRGGSWTSEPLLDLSGLKGTEAAPVTIGAYGAVTEPLPTLRKVVIDAASNLTVRDLESTGSDQSSCVNVTNSDHVIIQGVTAHHCSNNGIRFAKGASFGTIVDCLVRDIPSNDALSVHESTGPTLTSKVGDHFWLVDNKVPGPVDEQPIDVATGADGLPGAKDIKVVGNLLTGGGNGCIALGHNTSVSWVLGNILGKCTRTETASAMILGGTHGQYSGRDFRVSGNLVFWNLMSNAVTGGEAPMTQRAWFDQNTFVGVIGRRALINIGYAPASASFERNILWATGGTAHIDVPSAAAVSTMSRNAYIPGTGAGCNINGSTLAQWQASTGFDVGSTCGSVPGLALPSQAAVDAFGQWTSAAFLDNFKPDASWGGCANKVGAIDCTTGRPRVEFKPIPGYDHNGGYGWAGPLIVRQRYPLP